MRSSHTNKNKPIAMQETASLRNDSNATSFATSTTNGSTSTSKRTSGTGSAALREAVQLCFCPRGAMVFVWMFIFLCLAQIYVELFVFREHEVDNTINDMMQWNRKANANFTLSPRLQNVIGVRLINGNQLVEASSLAGHEHSSSSSASSSSANKNHKPTSTMMAPTTWSSSTNVTILSNISFQATYEWNLSESNEHPNNNNNNDNSSNANETSEMLEEENRLYMRKKAICFTSLTTQEVCRLPISKMKLSREARLHRHLRLCQNADILLLSLPEVAELEQMQHKYSHRLHTLEPILAKNKYKGIVDDDREGDVCWSNNKVFTIANYHFTRAFLVPETSKLQHALPHKGKIEHIEETTDITLENNKSNGNDINSHNNKTNKKTCVKNKNDNELFCSACNNTLNNLEHVVSTEIHKKSDVENNYTITKEVMSKSTAVAKNVESKSKKTVYETRVNTNLAHSFALTINYTEERQWSGRHGRRNEDVEYIHLLEVTKFTELFTLNHSFTPLRKTDFFYDAYAYNYHHHYVNDNNDSKEEGVASDTDDEKKNMTTWNPSNSTGIVCFISKSLHDVEIPGIYTYDNNTNKIHYWSNISSHSNVNRNIFKLKEQLDNVQGNSLADNSSTDVPQIVYFASHTMEWFRAHWILFVTPCDTTSNNVNNSTNGSIDQATLSHKWFVPHHIMPAQRELYWLCYTHTGILEYRPHQDRHTFYDVTEKWHEQHQKEFTL